MTLTELETLALHATPEWVARQRFPGNTDHEYTIETPTGGILFRSTSYGNMRSDAKYIHSASPATVLALIERCRAMDEALRFYAEKDAWAEFRSDGNIFGECEGDHMFAFDKGEDAPWSIAANAVKLHGEAVQL